MTRRLQTWCCPNFLQTTIKYHAGAASLPTSPPQVHSTTGGITAAKSSFPASHCLPGSSSAVPFPNAHQHCRTLYSHLPAQLKKQVQSIRRLRANSKLPVTFGVSRQWQHWSIPYSYWPGCGAWYNEEDLQQHGTWWPRGATRFFSTITSPGSRQVDQGFSQSFPSLYS